ncbi:phospholipase D-like domain-containing protein [Stenotrophobium rhamnosiphilum]|nr:phospholipase D-like domain-containing protein [Stenotrophobium rhamnosiphilum]
MATKIIAAFEFARRQLSESFAWVTGCKLSTVAVLAIIAANTQGCATLPDAKHDMATTPTQKVEFEDTRGPVSAAKGEAILEHIEDKHGDSEALQNHLAYEQAVNANSPLVLGNKLKLLQNGPATYESMMAAIRGAKDNINLETFIFDDDKVGRLFSDLLLKKQAEGVQVNIIYDSIGGLSTPQEFFDRLREGGINVLEFNPVNPLSGKQKSWLINNRDHRKQLIVDGRIAFTGGINISDTYSSAPSGKLRRKKHKENQPKAGWRDTHIRIEGPVVAEFQKMFLETWARQNGEPLAARHYLPEIKDKGDEIVRAIGSTPGDSPNLIFLTLISAITHAERKVHLTIAYFAPDPQLLKALTDAAQRGVDVKLVLPSFSDSWPIFNLGRSYYSKLLRGGVKIYERHGSVMHAKTACIDGVWSTIGSTNLDWRSFLHNDEINAVILSSNFAKQMDTMFAEDLKESEEIVLSKWKHRSWFSRLKERTARIGAYWL